MTQVENQVRLVAEAWQRNDIYQAVLRERAYQYAKWGKQEHSPEKWLTILMEEVGEAAKGSFENDLAEFRKELVQVIAVAFAILENHGFDEREENKNQE